jgi:hypothetical protein
MKSILLTGWGLMRLVRLATGISGIGFGIIRLDWLLGIAGIILLLMALFNLGNCGVGGCTISPYSKNGKAVDQKTENVNYQEVA